MAQIPTRNIPKHIPLSVRQQEMGGTFRLRQLINKECDELNCVPSNSYVEAPNASTCECDKFGDKVFKKVIKLKWQPTPVLLPGKSHGRRSMVGCSPWGCTESDTTEVT